MKKLALLISGQYRHLEKNINNFKERFYNKGYDIDIFLYFWESKDINFKFINSLNIIKVEVHPQVQFETEKYVNLINAKNGRKPNPFHILSMYYAIKECNKLKQKYEQENNFIYDLVIRLRTDITFPNEILIKNINYILINGPSQDYEEEGYGDLSAIGPSNLMDLYANTYDLIDEVYNKKNIFYCGEYYLGYSFRKQNIPFKLSPPFGDGLKFVVHITDK